MNWPEDAEHPPVGGWRGSTGIGARDEADLGSEQNTQQEEATRERSVSWRRTLEEVDRSPDISDLY